MDTLEFFKAELTALRDSADALLRLMDEKDVANALGDRQTRGRDIVIYQDSMRVCYRGVYLHLPRMQYMILELLVSRPGMVRTRQTLMEYCYSANDVGERYERVIDSNVKKLRKALRAIDPNFCAIRTIYGFGYIWEPEHGNGSDAKGTT